MANGKLLSIWAGIIGFSLALLTTPGTVCVMAQAPATRPAPRAQFGAPPVRSPEVSADSTVTFRLMAPNAMTVTVRGITPQPLAMQKDEMGVWSVTTAPLKPDLYPYSFDVDGLSTLDPSNTRFMGTARSSPPVSAG